MKKHILKSYLEKRVNSIVLLKTGIGKTNFLIEFYNNNSMFIDFDNDSSYIYNF